MDKVSTDAEETFAVIWRNTSGKAVGGWLTLTEVDGLKELSNVSIVDDCFSNFYTTTLFRIR